MDSKNGPGDGSPQPFSPSSLAPMVARRGVLAAAAGAGVAGFLPSAASGAAQAPSPAGLPAPDQLAAWTKHMIALGQRYAGSDAHRNYVDFLAAEFQQLGLTVKRDSVPLEYWEAQRWGLSLDTGNGERELPVAAYYTASGATTAEGVAGEIIWLDGPSAAGQDLSGKLVAFHRKAPKDEAVFERSALRYTRPSQAGVSMDRQSVVHMIFAPELAALKAAGAAGVILVEDDVPALCLQGAYAPFHLPYQDIPALFVDAATGRELERHAGRRARLRLQARREQTSTDHISAIFKGRSDEVILVASHSDGPNAFEENGSIGLLALAHHLATIPGDQLPRTVVLACVSGHMASFAGKDFAGWLDTNTAIRDRAVVALAIEHLGATEWTASGTKSRRTGAPEQGLCFMTEHPKLQAVTEAAFARADLQNSVLLHPAKGWIPGIANATYKLGIPTIGYLTAPDYLISWDSRSHFDKFDSGRMHRELVMFADLLHRFGAMDRPDLPRNP